MSDQHHFFASSCLHWTTDADLAKCLQKQKKVDCAKGGRFRATKCNVYKVPLPQTAHYRIENYVPDVEGVEFITTVNY